MGGVEKGEGPLGVNRGDFVGHESRLQGSSEPAANLKASWKPGTGPSNPYAWVPHEAPAGWREKRVELES